MSAKVVAVLPAYDLASSIGDIVKRTIPFVDAVIVVADGSHDATGCAAAEAGAIVPEVRAVRGKGNAIVRGIEAARALQPEIVVLLDSDGQHLPEEIPVLLAPLRHGKADVVSGSRMLGTLRTSTINRFGNYGLRLISFAVCWRWLTDTETGFRAFRAPVLFAMPLVSERYEIESEIMLRSIFRRLRIVEVPITVPFAVPGVTVRDGLKVGWYKVKQGLGMRLGFVKP
jgi:glycosyltransferase involved in cell wall biosynthesis